MTKQTLSATTKMEPNGRVMIPASIRKKLDIKSGASLVIMVQNNQVIMKNTLQVWEDLRAEFTKSYKGKKLLSEELMEDRRKEAIREGYA